MKLEQNFKTPYYKLIRVGGRIKCVKK